ncbi:non-homologous end-joining DNA ligase [Sphingosinicella sp. CPCC 101087]|uniref:non-homologous end-joining DNA ligase n=1 Tax=Sphingosinicella sp. CPCC 101087 TaxID=2497754 RepID=UPI0013E9CD64|nr:non-homologous end-joining DNA ligase [Sphingosinicella sp. CPCC 101087]
MSERIVEGVRLSHPDKVLFPEQGITKSDLADHYVAVAPHMLPHVAMRPITMVRCPTGRQKNCFYQRHAGAGTPRQIEKIVIPGFDNPYLFIRDLPGLIALVQIGVLEIHPWGVTADRPGRPDRVIFDLDPGEGTAFRAVAAAAIDVRERLDALGLVSFVKTTGGKGLHVVLPIEPQHEWAFVKDWAKSLSEQMAADSPDLYLTRAAKAERVGRIFIDYLRNDPTATAVAPYSTRARRGAPVAMPIDWDQVGPDLDPALFSVETAADLLARRKEDPWAGMARVKQRLPKRPPS